MKFEFKKHYNEKILIFNSCYVNYNDSKIGEALVKVLEKKIMFIWSSFMRVVVKCRN